MIEIKKIVFSSILIQLNSFVTKNVFWPQPKNPGLLLMNENI
jgi:hypothetical protein